MFYVTKSLQPHHRKHNRGTFNINDRVPSDVRFAEGIDVVGRAEKELQELTTRLENMEMRTEKSKHIVSNCHDVKVDI